jgi:nucleotide-binding universal stress UspA family protein
MSAIKSILVHLDASPRCAARLQAAARLSEQHGAEVMALYAVIPQSMQLLYFDALSIQLLEAMRAADDTRRMAAQALFDDAVASGLKGAKWLDPLEDMSLRAFARQALYADLVVLGQRERDGEVDSGVPKDFVESVLIDSGKPILVVPYIGLPQSLGRTVMVAWKETREAARAVAAALPLLSRAEGVHVATWSDEHASERERLPALLAYLDRHGIAADLHHYGDEPRNIGDYILSSAADLNADMLVMGGYSHSRARELILGGATRAVLESMTVPVLMVH